MHHLLLRGYLYLFIGIMSMGSLLHAQQQQLQFRLADPIARNVPNSITLEAINAQHQVVKDFNKTVTLQGLDFYVKGEDNREYLHQEPIAITFENGTVTISHESPVKIPFKGGTGAVEKAALKSDAQVVVKWNDQSAPLSAQTFNAWWTIIPPLLAILLAIVTKEVLLSLFLGIWVAVVVLADGQPVAAIAILVDTYIIHTVTNEEYAHIIVFSLTIGGIVGVIARSGGIHDLVEKISKLARSARSGMISTWLMGLVIFFDDYANTLLVGNSMRAITDRLRVSREKLTYIVDSTAAPVCSIVLISTWIGMELGLIGAALAPYGQEARNFEYFLASIPYHFYSIFTIIFVFAIAALNRDFGPMLEAEARTRRTGDVHADGARPLSSEEMESMDAPEGKPRRWYNALIPIFVVIITTILGLYFDGFRSLFLAEHPGESISILYTFTHFGDYPLREIVSQANSYDVLIWAGVWGSLTAGLLALIQRILNLGEILEAWVKGVKSMMLAVLVLILAWTLKDICGEIGTNKFIFYSTKDLLSANLLPVLSFLLASVVAFATGTSWGTMGLLFPLIMPLAIDLSQSQLQLGVDTSNYVVLGVLGSILAGASFGDHCSPISDTTVMSSMACGCDHIDHVKTQFPYAMTSAGIACAVGYIPIGFGFNPWISLVLGIIAMVVVILVWGKNPDTWQKQEQEQQGEESS